MEKKAKDMAHRLTRGDIQKMEEEIERRKLELRPELIEAVKEARAHGDLSENFEYYAAKREKNKNESRIRYLERMIRTCEIIETEEEKEERLPKGNGQGKARAGKEENGGVVSVENTVGLYFEEDGETETYRIVTTVRENPDKGLISVESPLGRAILGKKKGDRVFVRLSKRAADNGEAESEASRDNGFYVVVQSIDKTRRDGGDTLRQF